MPPVGVKIPVAGSYSSALGPLPLSPPAIKTIPLFNSVAVWYWRAVFMLPVGTNIPCCASEVLANVVKLAHSKPSMALMRGLRLKLFCWLREYVGSLPDTRRKVTDWEPSYRSVYTYLHSDCE